MIRLDIDGWRCAAHASGPADGPLVLLLHGFPDTARTFDRVRASLGESGRRAVAPYMHGVPPSGPAPAEDYSIPRIANDVAGLVRALGRESATVVGHDWGAVVGCAAATLHPDVVTAAVAVSVPPIGSFIRSLLSRQLVRGAYVVGFQTPLLPEHVLGRDDFAGLERLWRRWSPGWEPDRDALADMRRAYRHPGTLSRALAWYRAAARGVLVGGSAWRRALAPVPVRALQVAGTRDACVSIEVNERAAGAFSGPLEFARLDAGHFPHLECPARFDEVLLDWLDRGDDSRRVD